MRELIRRVRFAPYRRGTGPRFALTLWETGRTDSLGKCVLGYRLTERHNGCRCVLFEGEDLGCSPLHATDSDATVAAVMGFLTLRPGDTDRDYFADYTPAQLAFAGEHAEALACEVETRFREGAR